MTGMVKETFDINEIIGIRLTEESEADRYEWVDAVPEKRIFLGLIKTRSATPEGFLDLGSLSYSIYTPEELVGYGYKVYLYEDKSKNCVTRKPHVKIYLSYELTADKVFETEQEAQAWIEKLKSASGKTFETIVH
jgi:hypothetical protein